VTNDLGGQVETTFDREAVICGDHTHVALEADLQYSQPRRGRNNYT